MSLTASFSKTINPRAESAQDALTKFLFDACEYANSFLSHFGVSWFSLMPFRGNAAPAVDRHSTRPDSAVWVGEIAVSIGAVANRVVMILLRQQTVSFAEDGRNGRQLWSVRLSRTRSRHGIKVFACWKWRSLYWFLLVRALLQGFIPTGVRPTYFRPRQ